MLLLESKALKEGGDDMTGYINEKRKTPGYYFWRLCLQTAGAIGVFFIVLSLFQWNAPQAAQLQQTVRECFTSDTDITPVIQWFENSNTNHTTDVDAIQVYVPGY